MQMDVFDENIQAVLIGSVPIIIAIVFIYMLQVKHTLGSVYSNWNDIQLEYTLTDIVLVKSYTHKYLFCYSTHCFGWQKSNNQRIFMVFMWICDVICA